MGCDFPLTAYRSQEFNPETGRYRLTFNSKNSLSGTPIKVPCSKCIGCKLERSRQWAVRCQHEASLYQDNCFITLTYDREHLPVDYSVHPRVMQLFMKKLRKHIYPRTVRFFVGAEYGDENLRPHYHILLFGYDFEDKTFHERTPQGHETYLSKTLTRLWGNGHHNQQMIGAMTFESAAYTARYSTKKTTGPKASGFYLREHPDHHFICRVRPEFGLMSRRPGIGSGWLAKYKDDTYPSDTVISNGREARPPRFYDQQLTEEELRPIQLKRQIEGKRHARPQTFNAEMAHVETRAGRMRSVRRKL